MNIEAYKTALYRIPQFSLNANLKEEWDELKESIRLASPYFHGIIKDLKYSQIKEQSESIQFTIAKYFNRSKFRSTPFATFSSIGLCQITNSQTRKLLVQPYPTNFQFVDWKQTKEFKEGYSNVEVEELNFQANTSYYKVGDQLRYIFRGESCFELSDVNYYPEIEDLLLFCTDTKTYSELEDAFHSIFDAAYLKVLLLDLLEVQLLFCQFKPNIIGPDYFVRNNICRNNTEETYNISVRNIVQGELSKNTLNTLNELIQFLNITDEGIRQSSDLEGFIESFKSKYDLAEIPLMLALDPEIGVGYGGMDTMSSTSGLIKKVLANKGELSPAKKNLLDYIDSVSQRKRMAKADTIMLDQIEIPEGTGELPLPNTFSALISISDELILLESLGGATANMLLGRFSIANKEIETLCCEVASQEQEANPHVLFFDIAYQGEPEVDNINRRSIIYDYRLNIDSFSLGPGNLSLDDILVSVRNDEVILFSKKHRKRIIPRLSSAYSYVRSDLSLFRFLCDLQHQGIQSTLLPDFSKAFKEADMIPRIQYKNIVVSPAKWKIKVGKKDASWELVQKELKNLNIPRYIKAGQADQTLMLDCNMEEDIKLLHSILNVKKELWIQEAFVPENSIFQDVAGRAYNSEFVITFMHRNEIYKGYTSISNHATGMKRNFSPGSKWLYFEIYGHPNRMDSFLSEHISCLVSEYSAFISKWFFIRYEDGGEHIRFRVAFMDSSYIGPFIHSVYQEFGDLIDCGIISDIKVCTYHRELERYGADIIEEVEQLFCVGSVYILDMMKSSITISEKYLNVILLITEVGEAVFGSLEFTKVIKRLKQFHNEEHRMDHNLFKQLNKEYKSSIALASYNFYNANKSGLLINTMKDLLVSVGAERRLNLFADLFHMHINRVFNAHQRVHEMIIYNYLLIYFNERLYNKRSLSVS